MEHAFLYLVSRLRPTRGTQITAHLVSNILAGNLVFLKLGGKYQWFPGIPFENGRNTWSYIVPGGMAGFAKCPNGVCMQIKWQQPYPTKFWQVAPVDGITGKGMKQDIALLEQRLPRSIDTMLGWPVPITVIVADGKTWKGSHTWRGRPLYPSLVLALSSHQTPRSEPQIIKLQDLNVISNVTFFGAPPPK